MLFLRFIVAAAAVVAAAALDFAVVAVAAVVVLVLSLQWSCHPTIKTCVAYKHSTVYSILKPQVRRCAQNANNGCNKPALITLI